MLLLSIFNYPFRITIQQESSFHVEESFLARWKRVLTTDCLCCLGCSDLTLRYLSECVGLRYTAENKWPLGERLTRRSKNGRHPSFSFSIVLFKS